MAETYEFSSGVLNLDSVDKENGIIRGVAVITKDVTAKGHNLEVDEKTLKQLEACGKKMKKVPVKWNHKTGADAVNGYLTNFSIKDGKLKADWHLLKTHKQYEHAIELAERMPEGVGLSAAFRGKSESSGLKKFARCRELVSVDLVATPAANPDGLFSEGDQVDTPSGSMAKTTETAEEQEFSIGDVMQGIAAIQQNQQNLSERMESVEEFAASFEEEDGSAQQVELSAADVHEASPTLVALNERLESQVAQREEEQRQNEFDALEERVDNVVALNAQLVAENEALATALHELSEGTATMAETDAGMQVQFSSVEEQNLTEFEVRTKELEADGKSLTEAITFAVSEDQDRYTQHLKSKGAIN